MLPTGPYVSPLGAVVLGLLAHHLFFIRGEWHVQAPLIFRFYAGCCLLVFAGSYKLFEQNLRDCLLYSSLVLSCHFAALCGSVVVYRAWFHPLRRFRGPFPAKISKLWHVWQARDSQNHLFLENIRHRYGNFARTGPNEITIFHPDGLNAVNKADDVERSGWYDLLHPSYSLNTIRDQHLHERRRKVWEPAFTTDAMRDYEKRIRVHASRIEKLIRRSEGNMVDMNSTIYQFAYGVMRDLAFAIAADDDDRGWQTSLTTIRAGLSILGPLTPAPWIALLAFSFTTLPLVRDWNRMMAYCTLKMTERINMPTPERRDISAWLIEDAEKRGQASSPTERRWLDGDAFAVILAGSDTTASTLVFAFLYLGRFPEFQARIYAEIRTSDDKISGYNFTDLHKLPFLNALINETLRLHHPLPSTGSRVTRQKGLTIGDTYIPGGTEVVAPRWSFGREAAHYKRAWDFLPERWLSNSDLVLDRRAFTPWASGKWSCLGKQIALFELRYLITLLVRNFEISLPPGNDGSSVERDYKDQVTAFPGQLSLVFRARSPSRE